ncbi:hypothetical protein ACTXT7_002273 [Hymenolepis weldensis]
MSTKTTQENRLMRAQGLLKKLKHPEKEVCLWFFSDEKTSTRMKKLIEEIIDVYVQVDPTEVLTVMRTKFPAISLRVNTDADAYVEALQTIAVKPPCIDSVANGGRPYIFQQDSAPSHKALKTQDWMDDPEFSSSCHTKLPMAS